MSAPGGMITGLIGLGVVLLMLVLMFLVSRHIHKKNWREVIRSEFRQIEAFDKLQNSLNQSVEKGERAHFSLGSANMWGIPAASTLVGLSVLGRLLRTTAISDKQTITTSGNGTINILSQDVTQNAQRMSGLLERYTPSHAQLTGITPYSYAIGTLPVIMDQDVTVNVFLGHFREEVVLMVNTSESSSAMTLAGSDDLSAQAILYTITDDHLIGEELFAASAYTQVDRMHVVSLRSQDLLRWIIVVIILAGITIKLWRGL